MRRWLINLLLIMFCFNVIGQNLVLNSGFEENDTILNYYDSHPKYSYSNTLCNNWYKLYGTSPDYYSRNNKNSYFGIPNNMFGYHNPPDSGSAYIGSCILSLAGAIEPLIGTFSQPLEANAKYNIKFQYKFAGTSSYFYLDKLEIYIFKTKDFLTKWYIIPYLEDVISPDIVCNVTFENQIINDGQWHQCDGYYYAKGGEEYFAIGIFYQSEKFIKIIKEYINNNYMYEYGSIREKHFFDKYKNYLCIQLNPNFKPSVMVLDKLGYYFFDNFSVIKN